MTCDAWEGGANGEGQGMNHGRGDSPKNLNGRAAAASGHWRNGEVGISWDVWNWAFYR